MCSVSSFCVELSSCRVGGCRVGPPPSRYRRFTVDLSSCVSMDVYGCLWLSWYLRESMYVYGCMWVCLLFYGYL